MGQRPVAILELERIAAAFVALFEQRFEVPSFVLELGKKCVFRYVPVAHHIEVGTGFLSVPIDDLPRELLHELIHAANKSRGIADTSSHHYHNDRFREAALSVGLFVGKHPSKGWSVVRIGRSGDERLNAPTPKDERRFRACWARTMDRRRLLAARRSIRTMMGAKSGKVSVFKYICGCKPPYNSIRSGRRPEGKNPLVVRCEICNQRFVIAPRS